MQELLVWLAMSDESMRELFAVEGGRILLSGIGERHLLRVELSLRPYVREMMVEVNKPQSNTPEDILAGLRVVGDLLRAEHTLVMPVDLDALTTPIEL